MHLRPLVCQEFRQDKWWILTQYLVRLGGGRVQHGGQEVDGVDQQRAGGKGIVDVHELAAADGAEQGDLQPQEPCRRTGEYMA